MITNKKGKILLKEVFTKLIGSAIVQSGRALRVYNLEMFAKHNFEITPEQNVVLSMLNEDSPLHQNELCEALYKDKSNMTRIISVLEEKGLVKRVHGVENKKQVNKIQITKEGKKMRDKIAPVVKATRENYLKGVEEDDMYICLKVLGKIQENLLAKD